MKRIIFFLALVCSLSVTAQRVYRTDGTPQRFVNSFAIPVQPSTYYNSSSDSAILFFDRNDTNTVSFRFKGLVKKLGLSRMQWDSIIGIPANFTTTYALSNDIKDSIQDRLRIRDSSIYYGNVVRTFGNQDISGTKRFMDSLRLGSQPLGDTSISIGQVMAVNDYWHIYGADSANDYGEMVFKVGDNGAPYRLGGQRFRFTYDGTGMIAEPSKDVLIIDYDTISTPNTIRAASFARIGGLPTQYQMADGSVSTLANPITGTGTNNFMPIFTSTSTIGNSIIFSDPGGLGIGTTSILSRLNILALTDFSNIHLSRNLTANTAQRTGIVTRNFSGTNSYGLIAGADIAGTNASVVIGLTGSIGANTISFNTAATYGAGSTERGRFSPRGAFLLGTTTDNGADIFQAVGSGNFSGGFTAQRLRGTSLVLNADSIPTTTTNTQVLTLDVANGRVQRNTITSGTYSPTLVAVNNVTSGESRTCYWTRVGNVVTVSGYISITTTSNSVETVIGIGLPIASNFTGSSQASGSGNYYISSINNQMGRIDADATNDRATLRFFPVSGSGGGIETQFTFTYIVL